MSSITEKFVLVSACLIAAMPAASAKTVTLVGDGVTIRYEDKAVDVFGAPSLIATSLMATPASFAGAQGAAAAADKDFPAAPAGRFIAGRDELPRSFADGAALRFSLDDAGGRDPGLYSLLLAGLGLFGLIARQRIAALSRSPHSLGFL